MYFLHTEMHMVTFLITAFEIVMLVFQIIYFLQRPDDKSRLRYLILLMLLICHNICSGLLPDRDYPIPIIIQTIIAYSVAFTMSMYVVYYFYKAFQLKHLRFFATYGLFYFLFLPFIFLFIVPLVITGNDRLSAKLTVVIPFLYGLGFIYSTARALILKFKNKTDDTLQEDPLYEHAIAAFISMVCWASLPVIVFFGDFQVLEHSVTNAGFLMMTIIYVRSAIKQSRKEYQKLIETEDSLRRLNKNLKDKVKQRTIELEKLIEERKTTFINLAHETKTPLTLIDNYLNEYIQKHGGDKEIQIVKNNIHRLTTDIVNFFHLESYEKGFSVYNHDQVSNFSTLLSSKLTLFKSFAFKKKIDISYSIEPFMCIKAHASAIDRITNNLLENAIKYSNENSKIDVKLYSKGDTIVFSVADTGPGIPQELHEKIFEPYFKLSTPNSNDGMGMGLSIVKRIVTDLKGEISLSSRLNEGTEISILLPIFKHHNENVCEQIESSDVQFAYNQILLEESVSVKDKPFILIVEDNVEMMNYLVNKIKINNNVLIARNGKEALTRIEDLSSLDLIISDVMMPDMDGFTFCEAVLGKEKFAHIPFIFLTARATEEDRIRGLKLGAVDYIEKPFKIEELLKKIDSILTTLKRQRTAVINKAYHSILNDHNFLQKATVDTKRCAFTDNCKKYHLTSREVEIINLLLKGQPNKLIGDTLYISSKTVGKHISNIFTKVGVSNRLELLSKLDAKQEA